MNKNDILYIDYIMYIVMERNNKYVIPVLKLFTHFGTKYLILRRHHKKRLTRNIIFQIETLHDKYNMTWDDPILFHAMFKTDDDFYDYLHTTVGYDKHIEYKHGYRV